MSHRTQTYSSKAALQAADAALTAKGRSFHWARRLLGPVHATRATRLYGICRYIDDLADEGGTPDQAREALTAFSHDLRCGVSNNPVVLDALALLQECQINPDILQELLKGVFSDLGPVRIHDENALIRYCYQVAGTVGLMMCSVLDVKNPKAFAHAIDLGIAMQLTNICRDVKEDAQNNRRYLPGSDVGNLEPDALADIARDDLSQKVADKARLSMIHLLALADVYYRSGEDGLAYLPPGARCAILVAGRVYSGIGNELALRGYDFWTRRVKVSTFGKARITAGALLTCTLKPSFWRPARAHAPQLHRALVGLPGIASTPQQASNG